MSNSISSWGGIRSQAVSDIIELKQMDHLPISPYKKGLPVGNFRSYGDVCLNPGGLLWGTKNLDRFIKFDINTGLLTCETGILLRDIQRLIVPSGWILPVTPGTQLITVGGAIANDVHGKNHHLNGSFGDHIKNLRLLRTNGDIISCGPKECVEWFEATLGGMGLTGVVTQATIQLQKITSSWLEVENIPFENLEDFFRLSDESESTWEHTVAWIDCLNTGGRGIFMRARHIDSYARPQHTKRSVEVSFTPPVSLINKLTLRPFNWVYYEIQSRKLKKTIMHYDSFFYPLDGIHNWNRIYGSSGFYQYQSVVPRSVGRIAVSKMLKSISSSGEGSFLAVLKTFGDRHSLGMMGFPMPGVTLALDFPNKGAKTLALMSKLDEIVRDSGGRIYAAKDDRMPRDLWELGYPQLSEFLKYRDPGISSSLSRRLMGS